MKKQTMIEIQGGGATRKTAPDSDLTISHSEDKDNLSPKPLKSSCLEPFYENRYVILNLIQNLSILIKSIRKDSGSEAGMTCTKPNILHPKSRRAKSSLKAAFTMAEVLITLGIIGIVAAMTLPAVIKKYQEVQFKSAYKKAYSELSQVFQEALLNQEFTRTKSYDAASTLEEFAVFKSGFKIMLDC